MTDLQILDAAQMRVRLSADKAVDALARRLQDDPPSADRPARTRVDLRAGQMLLMPDESRDHVGLKLVSIARDNPAAGLPSIQGVYVLMDALTLTPCLVADAAELTVVRTSAMSLLAVQRLGVVPGPRITIVGAGPQALAHARAFASLSPSVIRLVVRDPARAAGVAAALAADGIEAEIVTAVPVADSDLIACTTTSRTPVFDSTDLPDHAVVVAVGSHEPDVRELDTALMARSWVVVESRDAARREAGDVVCAENECGRDVIAADLGELVRGEATPDLSRPRVFKSVGEAWEDLAVASALL